jgi:hypothetical protein
VPCEHTALKAWIRNTSENEKPSDFYQVCRKKFAITLRTLKELAQAGIWPARRWNTVLESWAYHSSRLRRVWLYVAPVLQNMPNESIQNTAHALSVWLQKSAEVCDRHEAIFLGLVQKLFDIEKMGDTHPQLTQASSHPVGRVTQGLLRYLLRTQGQGNRLFTPEIKSTLTQLCDTQIAVYQHARVKLTCYAAPLHGADAQWSQSHFLPLFRWTEPPHAEVLAMWRGILDSPYFSLLLTESIKADFLQTARHLNELDTHPGEDRLSQNYATLLTQIALKQTYTLPELQEATKNLSGSALVAAAQTLADQLESAGTQQTQFWENRVLPYWRNIWPQDNRYKVPELTEPLAVLAINADKGFAQAFEAVKGWLEPRAANYFIPTKLFESGLCSTSPKEALRLLRAVIADGMSPAPSEIEAVKNCLTAIKNQWPEASDQPDYQQLSK